MSNDKTARRFIARGLREAGAAVDEADSAADGFFLASSKRYGCIVLEKNLKDVCGISLLKFMRTNKVETPVIVLSGSGEINDTLMAFDAGADDYMRKPIVVDELAVRVRAIKRRLPALMQDDILSVGDLRLCRPTREVRRGDVEIELQPRCFALLETLMENAGKVVTRTSLLERVWEFHFEPNSSVVETYISRLRKQVDKPFEVHLIQTVRGGGYIIGAPEMVGAA